MLSEKKAVWLQSVQQIKEGDIFEGKVNCVTDFGAFVDLCFPDGEHLHTFFLYFVPLLWTAGHGPWNRQASSFFFRSYARWSLTWQKACPLFQVLLAHHMVLVFSSPLSICWSLVLF